VRAGLATLHGLLQLDPDVRTGRPPEKDRFYDLIDASGKLAELLPKSRNDLLAALKHDAEFRAADLPGFTRRAMDILALWMHLEALKLAGDARLDRARSADGQDAPDGEPTETEPGGTADRSDIEESQGPRTEGAA
jgi:hypothetical protein